MPTLRFTSLNVMTSFNATEGWLGEANVSCILRYRGVQLILAYSWARPAVLAVGKGRGGNCFYFFTFINFPFSHVPLFHLLYYLYYLSSSFLWAMAQNEPQGLTCRLTPTQPISQTTQ